MVVEAGRWLQPFLPHSSSPSRKRRFRSDAALLCRYVHRPDQSSLFGTQLIGIRRSRSGELLNSRSRNLKKVCNSNFDELSDEEFSKKILELASRFQSSEDEDDEEQQSSSNNVEFDSENTDIVNKIIDQIPNWSDKGEELFLERKAESQFLPHSLRMIQKKLQWQEGIREARNSASCSVKKAFSSMVFIIQELHSYTMQLRGIFYDDLQGVLARVQKEMHASFVWLFQQVFSSSPTLMVYVMILLANYSVYSIGSCTALAAPPPLVSVVEMEFLDMNRPKFDPASIKTSPVLSPSSEKATLVGGNNGGSGKVRPVSSGTEGDGGFGKANQFRTIIIDGDSSTGATITEAELTTSEESRLWDSIVQEASVMQNKDEALDRRTMNGFVSPVRVKIEADDYVDYFRTELVYQMALREEPNNPLLLANYAQFLWLVPDDRDRAEEYFKRATEVEPADAEAYNKYANFLWRIRNDLWAAEATFLGAISADPSNPYYAGTYADFLWDTGADDTCYPLKAPETS